MPMILMYFCHHFHFARQTYENYKFSVHIESSSIWLPLHNLHDLTYSVATSRYAISVCICIQLTCQQQNRKQQIYFVFGSMLSLTQFLPNRFNIIFQALLWVSTKYVRRMLHIQYSCDKICFRYFFSICVFVHSAYFQCFFFVRVAVGIRLIWLFYFIGMVEVQFHCFFHDRSPPFFHFREHCNNILYLIQHLPVAFI